MIGVNTSIFKSAGRKLVNLLGALKDRATYYENGTDSVAEKNRIDDLGVLDKATILLTPTATSDARVHSVKTYTGDEIATDGNFELTNNQNASTTGTYWTTGAGWSIEDGVVKGDGASFDYVTQSISGLSGKTIKVTFEIKDWVSGTFRVLPADRADGLDERYSGNGTYETIYTSNVDLFRLQQQAFDGSIDNISIKDVSSDFDFDRASSATRINSSGLVQDMQSITDPELVLNGDFEELGSELVTNGGFSNLDNWSVNGGDYATIVDGALNSNNTENGNWHTENISQNISFVNGKTYKISFKAKNISGDPNLRLTQNGYVIFTYNITSSFVDYEVYYTANADNGSIRIFCNDAIGEFQIDNVSVQQVDPNNRWTLSSTFEIDNGKLFCVSDGSYQYAYQGNAFVVGNTYKITFDVIDYSSGSVRVRPSGQSGYKAVSANGTYTQYFTATDTTLAIERDSACRLYIDNISVKDVTFSTDVDLARINYDSNGENGHILLEPTSTNLVGYSLPNDTNWSKGINTTITENYAVSPDGTQNASRFVMPTGSGTYAYYQFTATSTTDHTLSFYAKNNGGDADVTMAFFSPSGTKDITLTNEWQRFEFTRPVTSGGAVQVGVDNITSVDMLIYGVQCEALDYATSYIPTLTGSTVTRATETLTGSGNSTLINSTEGVLYAEIAALNDDISQQIGVYGNSSTEQLRLEIANSVIRGQLYNGAYQANMSSTQTVTNFNKIALKWKVDDFALWINGTEVDTDSSGTTFSANDLDRVHFSAQNGSSSAAQAKVKALAVFNEALTDDELELLTGVTNYGSFSELASANGYTII